MALFAEDQKFNSVNIHGVNENAQPEFLDVRFSRMSFGGSLTIYGGPGGIMLEVVLRIRHELHSLIVNMTLCFDDCAETFAMPIPAACCLG
jgi:hypothetical protein